MNLHELNYPMFETTKAEKEELKEVLKVYPNINGNWLCSYTKGSLKDKIQNCLAAYGFLSYYVFPQEYEAPSEEYVEIRKIWIEKLLNYTGETL